jgi:hypothetical protein
MRKKGQGLSLNTIIIAAIVLIVLVVLWAIFTGRMGVFSQGITDITKEKTCQEAGGEKRSGNDCGTDTILFGKYSNVGAGEICCKVEGTCTGTYGEGGAEQCSDFDGREEACKAQTDCTWNPPSI